MSSSFVHREHHGYKYALGVIEWCIFTGCCESAEQELVKEEEGRGGRAHEEEEREKEHRRHVANALCNYCAYLLVSAPELLPGSVKETREMYNDLVVKSTGPVEHYRKLAKDLAHMRRLSQGGEFITHMWALLYHLNIHEWRLPSNLHDIDTIDHAARIRTGFFQGNKSTVKYQKDDAIVVAMTFDH
ncbi:hypothetical protein HU200_051019 [Digitaria exilis]|uniref:Uncharacterized protein n=1 Tax=Digitaria exilis TaxID=1010633 RepID=A0A835AQP2_9POAL|nr:hypothetical protein HU200_051019 [Digitaria exilis]